MATKSEISAAADVGWRISTTEVGFDGVWSQPYEAVAVYHDGKVVKTYPKAGTILGKLLARFYIITHR